MNCISDVLSFLEKKARLPGVLHALLEDGNHGSC
jgi:hypothetical protein